MRGFGTKYITVTQNKQFDVFRSTELVRKVIIKIFFIKNSVMIYTMKILIL